MKTLLLLIALFAMQQTWHKDIFSRLRKPGGCKNIFRRTRIIVRLEEQSKKAFLLLMPIADLKKADYFPPSMMAL